MKKSKLTYNNFYYYLLLVLPLLVIYVMFFVIPVLQSMFYSFTNFNGLNPSVKFVGLNNYSVAFTDKSFLKATVNTVAFALGVTVFQNLFAILLALGLNRRFRGRDIMRTLVFAPCMLSPIVVAFLWEFIYKPDGLINTLFGSSVIWLGNQATALWAVMFAHVWMWMGYSATIYLSNLQNISEDVLEAAAMDGCGGWKRFWRIIFPMLAPSTTINVSLAFTQSLKIFDIVYAMTNGGPQGATETMGTYVMKQMNNNLHGYASALTVVMMVLIVVSGQFLIRNLKRREEALY
ncbi:ABC transporter permease [Oscillospiraceae bacterium]|uniref:carbohydrate ABC transporter permease n=1 Tax=Allofournierella sp. TaxID=1940256 RepID=UPI0015B0F57F|nr:ABC transporter permease [Oscillospiraceae bacterium]